MRNPRTKTTKRSRQARRALVALLVAASPAATAQQPLNREIGSMPPLPLQQTANPEQIKTNPFCETHCDDPSEPVSLASGSKHPSIRLMPIGAAIGLQTIHGGPGSKAPPPVMTIEPVAQPKIRNNPLIGSIHHANPNLVNAPIENDGSGLVPLNPPVLTETRGDLTVTATETDSGSSIILVQPKPMVPMAVATPPVIAQKAQGVEPIRAHGAQPIPVHVDAAVQVAPPMPGVVFPPTQVQPETSGQEAPVIVYEGGDAFSFSLSDQSSGDASGDPPAAEKKPIVTPAESIELDRTRIEYEFEGGNVVSEVAPQMLRPGNGADAAQDLNQSDALVNVADDINLSPADPGHELSVQADSAVNDKARRMLPTPGREPVRSDQANIAMTQSQDGTQMGLDVVEPIHLDGVAKAEPTEPSKLESIDAVVGESEQAPISIYRTRPIVAGHSPPKPTKAKRYRPPVAVTRVPIELSSDQTQSRVRSAAPVHSVESPVIAEAAPRGQLKPTPLHMSRAQVRSLTLGGEVRRVEIANEEICQAFASGPNQIKLIGTGNGVTRLVVWADTDDEVRPTRMRAFDVHVSDSVEATGTGVGDKAEILNHTIQRTFPNCDVRIQIQHGELIASGQCDSEESARQIMRMVRKTCLLPVQDELVIR